MDNPCTLDEDQLFDYILDAATDEVRAAIERSPACLAQARHLQQELESFQQMFSRSTCPATETLVRYQEGHLVDTEQLVVRAHVERCPFCQQEIALLAAVDATDTRTAKAPWRRVIEAFYQPPLALALRGSNVFHYQTTHASPISVNITWSRHTVRGKPRSWTMRGELRTASGDKLEHVLQSATLHQTDQPEPRTYQGTVHPDGSFVFSGLPTGTMDLSLQTQREPGEEEEIVIRQLVVGNR